MQFEGRKRHARKFSLIRGDVQILMIIKLCISTSVAGHSGRAVRGVGLYRLVAGIVGSNPAQGMDVCPRPSVLYCPV
jgi:hypothetical protein